MSLVDTDMGFAAIMEGLHRLSGSSFKAGLLPPTSQDVVDRGAENEFGTETVPARPFMRSAIDANEQEVNGILVRMVLKTIDGKGEVLKVAAVEIEDLIRKRIADSPVWAKELSPVTIAKKNFAHPLIDTSEMHDSISSEVSEGS